MPCRIHFWQKLTFSWLCFTLIKKCGHSKEGGLKTAKDVFSFVTISRSVICGLLFQVSKTTFFNVESSLFSFSSDLQQWIWRKLFYYTVPCKCHHITPATTLSISGLKSRVLKLPFFNLKMMMKNGLDFFLNPPSPSRDIC